MKYILYSDGSFNARSSPNSWGSVIGEDMNGLFSDALPEMGKLFPDMKFEHIDLPKNSKGISGKRCLIVSYFPDVTQQNNGGELLSFVAALRVASILNNQNSILAGLERRELVVDEIRTDSQLIEKYWSKGIVNKKIKECKEKYKYILESIDLRKKFEQLGGKVVKISGSDNAADCGYH